MKKIIYFFSAVLFLGLSSCEKNDLEAPGNIPGLGQAGGTIKIQEPFVMPDGIQIVGDITGVNNPAAKSAEIKSSNDTKSDYSCFGSGQNVRLKLTAVNSKNYPRTIYFPKGLIWKCQNGNFQHGLQCQTTWICLQPNSARTFYIDLYCANLGIPAPDQTATYQILGITSSKVLWNLLNLIGWRKVNYECYYGSGKAIQAGPTYEDITARLQGIVHNLTDRGIDIEPEDKAFIESIPEFAPEEIPQVDENSKYPEYFEEYKIPEK